MQRPGLAHLEVDLSGSRCEAVEKTMEELIYHFQEKAAPHDEVASADTGASPEIIKADRNGPCQSIKASISSWTSTGLPARVRKLEHAVDLLLRHSEKRRLATAALSAWLQAVSEERQNRAGRFFDAMGSQLRSARHCSEALLRFSTAEHTSGPSLLRPSCSMRLGLQLGLGNRGRVPKAREPQHQDGQTPRSQSSHPPKEGILLAAPPAMLRQVIFGAWQVAAVSARRRRARLSTAGESLACSSGQLACHNSSSVLARCAFLAWKWDVQASRKQWLTREQEVFGRLEEDGIPVVPLHLDFSSSPSHDTGVWARPKAELKMVELESPILRQSAWGHEGFGGAALTGLVRQAKPDSSYDPANNLPNEELSSEAGKQPGPPKEGGCIGDAAAPVGITPRCESSARGGSPAAPSVAMQSPTRAGGQQRTTVRRMSSAGRLPPRSPQKATSPTKGRPARLQEEQATVSTTAMPRWTDMDVDEVDLAQPHPSEVAAAEGEQREGPVLSRKVVRGPERFFYDTSLYTGCARFGSPSTRERPSPGSGGKAQMRKNPIAPGSGHATPVPPAAMAAATSTAATAGASCPPASSRSPARQASPQRLQLSPSPQRTTAMQCRARRRSPGD
eukprot:TRINITY_DN8139_c1_g3_i3.p1 TRINITY_DN8139_c1_g3~~TRINITY_DN8139_c1_g3_i3.p1  ORF type:complete len:644 (-),score=97.53 TRINITY_DN8139_c1_g3_i3:26-1882(-)